MMLQPTKDVLREQLALAADEIIRLRGAMYATSDGLREIVAIANRRWWHRFAWWRK